MVEVERRRLMCLITLGSGTSMPRRQNRSRKGPPVEAVRHWNKKSGRFDINRFERVIQYRDTHRSVNFMYFLLLALPSHFSKNECDGEFTISKPSIVYM